MDEKSTRSFLDVVNECDKFPYYQSDPKAYLAHISTYYHLRASQYPDHTLGYVLPSVAEVLRNLPDWALDDEERTLTLTSGNDEKSRSEVIARTCLAMQATGHFKILEKWRNELYPVYGPKKDVLFTIERAASALFGVVTYGVHMMAYTKDKESEELKLWVSRRAKNKQTYGGMLDNTVAGGIAFGEPAFESLVRECAEEASLPETLVRAKVKSVGVITYFYIRDARAGGETNLMQPECEYVYDLEIPEHVVPRPCDDEVEEFYLWRIDEVKEALKKSEFKPNCALVILDFFVRHGILTPENEKDFIEIVARLHRKLEFPVL